jgi:hypothetical protein
MKPVFPICPISTAAIAERSEQVPRVLSAEIAIPEKGDNGYPLSVRKCQWTGSACRQPLRDT